MNVLNALILISLYAAAFMLIAWVICELGSNYTSEQQADTVAALSELRYNGMLYLRNSDKPIEAWLHTGTGQAYYKIGLQFRNANTGRIVAYSTALLGE